MGRRAPPPPRGIGGTKLGGTKSEGGGGGVACVKGWESCGPEGQMCRQVASTHTHARAHTHTHTHARAHARTHHCPLPLRTPGRSIVPAPRPVAAPRKPQPVPPPRPRAAGVGGAFRCEPARAHGPGAVDAILWGAGALSGFGARRSARGPAGFRISRSSMPTACVELMMKMTPRNAGNTARSTVPRE